MQVFTPRALLLTKLALVGVPLLAAAAVFAFRWSEAMPHARGAAVAQPIPFSHKHHAGDDAIDCRYCHAAVETSRTAGLPATSTCLNCHAQLFRGAPMLAPLHDSLASGRSLAWQRVHDLPDFVYFDHSIHVHKGVSCGECHGPVDQMPLTWRVAPLEMQWCLDCHRNPAPHLHPAGEVFSAARNHTVDLHRQQDLMRRLRIADRRRLTDCSTCHR
ncbi:MAG TPA: cytochrome c3 family protein [Rhodocyclaceae bacterium]